MQRRFVEHVVTFVVCGSRNNKKINTGKLSEPRSNFVGGPSGVQASMSRWRWQIEYHVQSPVVSAVVLPVLFEMPIQ